MVNLLELIKNEKVEWRKLGDVSTILNGFSFKSSHYSDNGIRVIRISDVQKGRISDKDVRYYPLESEKEIKNYLLRENDLVMSLTGYVGRVAMISTGDLPAALNQRVAAIRTSSDVLVRYLYHYLNQNLFEDSAISAATGGGQKNLSTTWLANYEIPIPSLETQEVIAKTLDKFTEYVSELQAELQARNKQYSYYLDLLLSKEYLIMLTEKLDNFSEEDHRLEYVRLESVVKIKNGRDWKSLGAGEIPVYGSGGEMGVYVDQYSYSKPSVLIPRKGSIENVFYLDKPFWNVDTIFHTEINEQKLIPKYLYYFIQNYDISSLSTNSTRPSLTQSDLNKIILPLPSIQVQKYVVEIFDKFELYMSEAGGLLPEEIELREKQYSYYREKLLTFDKNVVNTHTHTHTHTQ